MAHEVGVPTFGPTHILLAGQFGIAAEEWDLQSSVSELSVNSESRRGEGLGKSRVSDGRCGGAVGMRRV